MPFLVFYGILLSYIYEFCFSCDFFFRHSNSGFMAKPLVTAGATVIPIGYELCPDGQYIYICNMLCHWPKNTALLNTVHLQINNDLVYKELYFKM